MSALPDISVEVGRGRESGNASEGDLSARTNDEAAPEGAASMLSR
jgi:hypothetical protein